MVWVPLKNGSGQVVKDIKLKAPAGAEVNKGNDKITLQKDKTFREKYLLLHIITDLA